MPGWLCWAKLTEVVDFRHVRARFSMIRTFVNTFWIRMGHRLRIVPVTRRWSSMTNARTVTHALPRRSAHRGMNATGGACLPNFNGYSYTGYQPIKYTLDDTKYDAGALNTRYDSVVPLCKESC